jgi:hypothetical protein
MIMRDEEIELNAQRALQEYDDAVENLDPQFKELGQKALTALDEFIGHWSDKPYMQNLGQHVDLTSGGHTDFKEYAERQVKWANDERERVISQISKRSNE